MLSVSLWNSGLIFGFGIGLANSEHSHPAGLLLKFTILLQFNAQIDRTKTGNDISY